MPQARQYIETKENTCTLKMLQASSAAAEAVVAPPTTIINTGSLALFDLTFCLYYFFIHFFVDCNYKQNLGNMAIKMVSSMQNKANRRKGPL